jgi:hypothetical protein
MTRKLFAFFFTPAVVAVLLAGCGNNSSSIGTCPCPTSGTCDCPATVAPVSISMTDDPPAGVSVLFFQVSLTNASLTPASSSTSPVSLLPYNTPVQIDVTQLQALSAFLSAANVPAGNYSGLNLTFANPQLVIFNQSDAALGSNCAVGSVCQLTPTFDSNSASLSFSTSPFPVQVSAFQPLGFLVDFHLNTVIQSDLSVNLAASNGVTIAQLPALPTPPQFGFVTGTVLGTTPSLNQFTLQTPWGQSFVIDTTASTTFNNFPASACTTTGFACLTQGQILKVEVSSVASTGNLTASEVDYVQAASTQTVEGTVIRILPLPVPAGELIVEVILHNNPSSASGVPLGGVATVTLASSAAYSIGNKGFTIPSGLSFTRVEDVTVGQNLQLVVEPGTLSTTSSGPAPNAWGPPSSISFTASAVELEPSQMTGSITAIDSGATSFTLGVAAPFFAPWPLPSAVSSFNVVTTSQTSYTGFNPDNFNGLATSDLVSVNGWLFPPTTGSAPNIAAQSVVLRPSPSF